MAESDVPLTVLSIKLKELQDRKATHATKMAEYSRMLLDHQMAMDEIDAMIAQLTTAISLLKNPIEPVEWGEL